MTRVVFETGAVGYIHSHFHAQLKYAESGEFDALVDGVEKRRRAGDSVYLDPNVVHGVVCREAGVLLDMFSQARERVLKEIKA
jgi:quercetin dioxygenase-like cupin family protein